MISFLVRNNRTSVRHYLTNMRQPDINRVKKAREHLKAATTILSNIKWENQNSMESYLISETKSQIQDADTTMMDLLNIQENDREA